MIKFGGGMTAGIAFDRDQRFTLEPTDRWARAVAGVRRWTLDVAACRGSHLAQRYFAARDNALLRAWRFGQPRTSITMDIGCPSMKNLIGRS